VPSEGVVAVAAGRYHSLFVTTDGTLWGMGWNFYGQLGNGTAANTNLPVSVASNVVTVAAGYAHSLFVKTDGTLWGMGRNNFGQLGYEPGFGNILTPAFVASNVVAVAAGTDYSLFVTSDGTLWGLGYNAYGQLGNGTTNFLIIPVKVASNVVAVAAGEYHSLFAKSDGTLWAMGRNNYGQLGNGTLVDTNRPVQVPGLTVASLSASDQQDDSLAVAFSAPQIAGPTNEVVVLGQPASLDVSVTNGDVPFSYQWQLEGSPLLSATNADYNLASVAFGDLGTYTVSVSAFGSVISSNATLSVNVVPANIEMANVIQTNGGTQSTLQFTGSPYYPYIVQAATNLSPPVNWQTLATNAADASGFWQFTGTNLNRAQGFYRVVGE